MSKESGSLRPAPLGVRASLSLPFLCHPDFKHLATLARTASIPQQHLLQCLIIHFGHAQRSAHGPVATGVPMLLPGSEIVSAGIRSAHGRHYQDPQSVEHVSDVYGTLFEYALGKARNSKLAHLPMVGCNLDPRAHRKCC